MKYTIIFCLLFVLINSKKEIKHKFSLLKGLKGNDYDDDSSCDADTRDKCKNLPIPEKGLICCYYEVKTDKNTEEYCDSYREDIVKYKDIYETKEYKAYLREEYGYGRISRGREPEFKKIEEKVTCKNGGYSYAVDTQYSDKEKAIFKNKEHCLKVSEMRDDDIKYDVGECKNYIVTDSAKSNGIECGYFIMNITLDTKETVYSKTCYLFNLKLMKKVAEVRKEQLFNEDEAQDIIDEMGIEGNVQSFIAEISNGKGKKITYDSKTKKISVEGSGFILTASKYLFLLFIILF